MDDYVINELLTLAAKDKGGRDCIRAIASLSLEAESITLDAAIRKQKANIPRIFHLLKGEEATAGEGQGYKRSGADKGYAYEHLLRLTLIGQFIVDNEFAVPHGDLAAIFPKPAGSTSIQPDLVLSGVGIEVKTTKGAEFGHFGVCCYTTASGTQRAYWTPIPSTAAESTYVKMGKDWTEAVFNKVRCRIEAEWAPGWEVAMCAWTREAQTIIDEAEEEGVDGQSAQRMAESLNIHKVLCPPGLVADNLGVDAGTEVLLLTGLLPAHANLESCVHTKADTFYRDAKGRLFVTFMEQQKETREKRAKSMGKTVAALVKSDTATGKAFAKVEAIEETLRTAYPKGHRYNKQAPTRAFKSTLADIAGKKKGGSAECRVKISPQVFADGYGIKKCQFLQTGGGRRKEGGLYSCGVPVQLAGGGGKIIPAFKSSLGGDCHMRFRAKESGTCFGAVVFDVSFLLGRDLDRSPMTFDNGEDRKIFLAECIEEPRAAGKQMITVGVSGPRASSDPKTVQALLVDEGKAKAFVATAAKALLDKVTEDTTCAVGGGGGGGGSGGGGSGGGGGKKKKGEGDSRSVNTLRKSIRLRAQQLKELWAQQETDKRGRSARARRPKGGGGDGGAAMQNMHKRGGRRRKTKRKRRKTKRKRRRIKRTRRKRRRKKTRKKNIRL